MSNKSLLVYRSSAGSGKTYTLAKEYLMLAIKRPAYFKHILAVTFTNKATAEMKERIIQYLDIFSRGEEHAMADEIMQELKITREELRIASHHVFSSVLHNYSQFSVNTIDAFFQKVIRSFAKEVGLHGGFQLELDPDDVLNKVIDEVFEDIGEDLLLTSWLVNFALSKVQEGKSWDIKKDILRFVKELFSEAYKGKENELSELASDKTIFTQLLKQLDKIQSKYESSAKIYAHHGLSIIDKSGLEIADFAYKNTGPAGYFLKLLEAPYDLENLKLSSRQEPALDTVDAWYSKASKKKESIGQVVELELMQHYNETYNYILTEGKNYASAQAVKRNIYVFGILLDVADKLKKYKEKEGIMLISDANSFLKKIVQDNDTPFVYEKTGAFYKNYLIDEFQDTSGFQWDNFDPLVENSMAEGNKNLLVGDVKQSIYRWRGGDWQLLQNYEITETTDVKILNTNYRSAKNVIDVNNSIFSNGADLLRQVYIDKIDPQLQDFENVKNKSELISRAYSDVSQIQPSYNKQKFEGYLSFSFIKEDKEEGKKWKDIALERVPVLLENLQERGIAMHQIAVLVRGNRDEKLIADYLMEYGNSEKAKPDYSYSVVSNESLLLINASAVKLIIFALQYLQNNADQIALAKLVYAYQDNLNATAVPDNIFNSEEMIRFLPNDFYSNQLALRKMQLTDVIEEIIRLFQLKHLKGEYSYIQSFQDVILDFSIKRTSDITAFMDWWEENKHKQYVKLSEQSGSARVMTVHKSKGLQFKAVILPFCNWSIDHEITGMKETRMWIGIDRPPYNSFPFLPINYGTALKNTFFDIVYYQEMLQAYMDNFNLLYVALTRAEDYLFTFSEAPGKEIKKVSDVLFEILKTNHHSLNGAWDEDKNIFRFGKFNNVPKESSKAIDENINKPKFELISNAWQNRLTIKSKAIDFFKSNEDEKKSSVNYGNLLHDLMSRIITTDQLPKALETMRIEGIITEKDKLELSTSILKMFENQQVFNWFDMKWKVKTEVPVIPKSGELSRMDRVMINKDQAIVVDYKTGTPRHQDQKQVKSYVQLLREMGFKDVSGYLLYVENAEVVTV